MTKIYARIISHVGGNLTFQVLQQGNKEWTDKQLGLISEPADNDEFISRVRGDIAEFQRLGIEVIWLP